MPAYNAAATISDAIESVLAQDGFSDWELVITDDGSTDDTLAIARSYAVREPRVRAETQPNAGTGAAINAAIERARGEFVVQLGADDMLLPEYCRLTDAFIREHPGFDIYASDAYRLYPDGRRVRYHEGQRFTRVFSLEVDDLLDAPLIYGAAAFRREWFDRVGGFRAEYHNEDYDFWLRAMIAGARHIFQPVPLALYRVVPQQKTADGMRAREGDIAILRDAIRGGGLTAVQVAHAERAIALAEKNVAFRKRVVTLVGPRLAQPVFAAAHKVAWLVRPHRRRRA